MALITPKSPPASPPPSSPQLTRSTPPPAAPLPPTNHQPAPMSPPKRYIQSPSNQLVSPSPFPYHPPSLIPPALVAAFPAGSPLTPSTRTHSQTVAFEDRKNEILSTMSSMDMERRYAEVAQEVVEALEAREEKDREISVEVEKLVMERELEVKVFKKAREGREA